MPNTIKHSTSAQSNALGVGDMHIGTNDVGKGPTSTTGFYNGINPPSGGYTVYLNKAEGGPSIYTPTSDAELIALTETLTGETLTLNQVFAYFAGQSDKMVMFNPINTMVTDDLVTCFMAGTLPSYPRQGTTWYDLSEEDNNGTLTNGPTFNSNGWMEFDGIDDRIDVTNPGINNTFSVSSTVLCTNVATSNNIVSKNGPYFMRIQSSKVRFNVLTSTGWLFQNGTTTLVNNTWYNFHMVYNGTTWKGYINGEQEFSVSKTGTISSNAALYIGYTPAGGEQAGFNGDIAKVSIYHKALTADEVTQNYYQAAIVTDDLAFAVDAGNLVSYENGDTTTNSLVSTDTGTLTNGVAFSSGNGGTWNFDDVDDYIAFGNPVWSRYIYTDPFSLEVWCKPDTTSGFKHLIGKSYSDYRLAQSGTGISFRLDSNNIATQFGTLVAGEWTHIVATWEPATSTAYVYQDGVLKGSVTDATVDWTSTSNNFQIGTSPGESYYFGGSIAIGRAYSKTLSLAEVGQNYNANINRFN